MEKSIVDILKNIAVVHPLKKAYVFLEDGDEKLVELNYLELDTRAKAIAAKLQSKNLQGEKAILLFHAGLEYITAFMGCLYAGVIAIPAYPPKKNKPLKRISAIIRDSGAKAAITTTEIKNEIVKQKDTKLLIKNFQWFDTDTVDATSAESYESIVIQSTDIAFLQYTSGSTGNPKGVMVTHENVLCNEAIIKKAFEHTEDTIVIGWLPIYHDMGLIGNILQPLYLGATCVFMSPVAFLQKPIRWLKAISKYKGTSSGAPNFAYDHCIDRISEKQLLGLDLSHWTLAFTGAEPVQWETIEKFTKKFAPIGFKKEAFLPCYGMAEATLFVSGISKKTEPTAIQIDASALEKDQVIIGTHKQTSRTLVSCGNTQGEEKVIIVDPKTLEKLSEDKVGEIWFAGKSVAQGYWNRLKETEETFDAYTKDHEGPFLRTGDLGFISKNEVYVTGRLKDLIIINGRNHYPQDIEKTSEESHEALKANCSAAFSIISQDKEQLVVVLEIKRTHIRHANFEEIKDRVREMIFSEHELQVFRIILLSPGRIPKTSSGKIQRKACKKAVLGNSLSKVYEWQSETVFSDTNKEERNSYIHNQLYNCNPNTLFKNIQEESTKGKDSKTKANELITWLRKYGQERINSRMIDERRSIPPYVILDFGNQGILGMQVPEAYGGLGLTNYDFLRVIEQLGAIDQTLASFVGINNVLGIRPIVEYASSEIKKELLPVLASGRELAAFAITETGAGSNPGNISSKAIPDKEGIWKLQGEKVWIGSGSWAGIVNVFVKEIDEKGAVKGFVGFMVRQGAKGFHQGPEALTMGMRGMVQNSIFLEDVPVETSQRLGESGQGMEIARNTMSFGRLTIAAASIGMMKRCAQLMIRYSSKRSVATGKLIENPVTLCTLNEVTASVTALEAFVYHIASKMDEGTQVPDEIFAICKTSAPELLYKTADSLVQLLGGRGYIETNIAPQILRDARLARIFEGPTETMQMFIGSSIVNQNEAIVKFIEIELKSPDIAQELIAAAKKIEIKYLNTNPIFDTHTKNLQWVNVCIGELTTYAVLLASVQGLSKENVTGETIKAIAWAKANFDKLLNKCLSGIYTTVAEDNSEYLKQYISKYSSSIGDIEQCMAGETHQLDEMLRKNDRIDHQNNSGTPIKQDYIEKGSSKNSKEIEKWMLRWLENKLRLKLGTLSPSLSFMNAGLDSITSVEFSDALGIWLNITIDSTIVWNYPTISTLAEYLSSQINKIPDTPSIDSKTTLIKENKEPKTNVFSSGELSKLEEMSPSDIAQLLENEINN